jgi:hypothetical protein
MKTRHHLTCLSLALLFLAGNPASATAMTYIEDDRIPNMIEDLNPFDPNIEQKSKKNKAPFS